MSPLFLVLLAVAALSAIVAASRKAQTAWAEAALRLGLSHHAGTLTQSSALRGRLKGLVVEVRVTGQGGKHNTTRYKVTFPALGLGLAVRRESFIDRALDRPDIQIGEAEFDALYLIQGDDPDRVRAFLTDARRAGIDRVLSRYAKCRVNDYEIRHKARGVERDPEQIVSTVKALVRLATVLIEESPAKGPTESVIEKRASARVFSEQDLDWEKIIVPVPVPETHADPFPDEATVTLEVSDLEPETVCGELFAEGRTSFETNQIFDERYRGQRVRWSGTLDRLEPYRDDSILGSGPGIKVFLDLPTVQLGARTVHLVVALPATEERALLEARGERMTIEGTMAHCDPYLWTVFLVDGARAG